MSFEVRKGRSCDSLQVLNERLIESQGVQLMNYDKALKLSESKSSTLEGLVLNAKEGQRIEQRQFNLDKDVLKRKVRKRNILIVGQSVVILLLVSTL